MTTSLVYNHNAYKLIQIGATVESNMYEAYYLIGDTEKARESFRKMLDCESTLSAIRLDFLRSNRFEFIPDFF